jgi:hypothetical protein
LISLVVSLLSGGSPIYEANAMKKDTKINRAQFLQKEEAWVIQGMVGIEKTKNPNASELAVTNLASKSMLIKESSPYIDTFENCIKSDRALGTRSAKV